MQGNTGVPPKDTFYYAQLLSGTSKKFFGRTRVYLLIWRKKHFLPNFFSAKYTSAWKKMLPKWQFTLPLGFWPEMAEIFQKIFWQIFCIILTPSTLLLNKTNLKNRFKMIFCEISSILPLFFMHIMRNICFLYFQKILF